ncbi:MULTISPECIES: SDR family oxidoreductase [Pontibacillus]|uniref:SDR family oxidoreductase n=1 Tax=Pontibacillus chungwhensis TaxID=265426 RepID=A0ABY8V4Z6_9BACI|nr:MULTISPECIES: SDR family oxidoreductase [Pontibacillus]MCD5322367.1 SDR family oxidoreductase [Pontibacillus sp. HN14]WIF99655.1 SDR family oxidoreductase [Pontibacillus chungwhensis]
MVKGRVAVVTGASGGFGSLTTMNLAKQGYVVLAAMRNMEKVSVFDSYQNEKWYKQIIPVPLDVAKEESIRDFKYYIEKVGRCDVLVNNAGYALGGFSEEIKIEEYRDQFETNVFGVMGITQAVLPTMRRQGFGKIINVSSISGVFGFPGLSPYVSSKYALEGYSESLRLEVKPFGIDVALVEPGSYETNIWTSGRVVTERSLQEDSPYYSYMESIEKELKNGKDSLGNPKEVADLITALANKGSLKALRYPVGKGVKALVKAKALMPWSTLETIILKKLKQL